jgi:hypothetical protein
VESGTETTTLFNQWVPFLNFSDLAAGPRFSYSPSFWGDNPGNQDDLARMFSGARTMLTLIAAAAAAMGTILPIDAPSNRLSYHIGFLGPAVECRPASLWEENEIDRQLHVRMAQQRGSAMQRTNAFFAFLPGFGANGSVGATWNIRSQAPTNAASASNQIWMVFQRYLGVDADEATCDYTQVHEVCELWDANYTLNLEWDNGIQTVRGRRDLLHKIPFPDDMSSYRGNTFTEPSCEVNYCDSPTMP